MEDPDRQTDRQTAMTSATLFIVFVNRMSLTLGTGQAYNDFCLLSPSVYEVGIRVEARERQRDLGWGLIKNQIEHFTYFY